MTPLARLLLASIYYEEERKGHIAKNLPRLGKAGGRMYRTIDSRLWTDPKIKAISDRATYLFLYLITNPHTHVSGIYYLARSTMIEETKLNKTLIDTACDTLSSVDLVKFDREKSIIWVINMMAYQGKGDKNARSAAFHLKEDLHNSFLIREFLEKYPHVKDHLPTDFRYPIDGGSGPKLSVPLLKPESLNLKPETRILKPEDCSEPSAVSEPTSVSEVGLLIFPCSGGGTRSWFLSQSKFAEYEEAFPGIDVMAECRKALQWCRDNPTKAKTPNGMPGFLGRWLAKAQDQLRVVVNSPKVAANMNHDGLRQFLESRRSNERH